MISFSKEDILYFIKSRPILILGVAILFASIGGFLFKNRIVSLFRTEIVNYPAPPEVSRPTIIGGDLVLPKVMLEKFGEGQTKESQIHVLSANLFGVFDQAQQQQNPFAPPPAPKLIGIRIMGEMENTGKTIVEELSPVVRFLDSNNVEISKKIGRLSPGFDFFGVLPNSRTLYDVIVDDPPQADKMEVVLNSASATTSAKFDSLKILNQIVDVKTAVSQESKAEVVNVSTKTAELATNSAQASGSAVASVSGGPVGSEGEIVEAPTEIQYYTVSGSVVNSLSKPVSDITVYVWVKDAEGNIFSFGRQDFKGDLISPKKTVEFKINLFPYRNGEKMNKYEVRAWGKRYTL